VLTVQHEEDKIRPYDAHLLEGETDYAYVFQQDNGGFISAVLERIRVRGVELLNEVPF